MAQCGCGAMAAVGSDRCAVCAALHDRDKRRAKAKAKAKARGKRSEADAVVRGYADILARGIECVIGTRFVGEPDRADGVRRLLLMELTERLMAPVTVTVVPRLTVQGNEIDGATVYHVAEAKE